MMFPTTVLSVLAVSAAAENTSSGNRGLRKSSVPYTAIAVVTGTALTGLLAGVCLGYFIKSQVGGGDSCAALTNAGMVGVCTGCAQDRLLTAAKTCSPCPTGKALKKNKGGKNFGDITDNVWEDPARDCETDGCIADFHQKRTPNICVACPAGQYIAASTTSAQQRTCTGCKANYYQSGGDANGGTCTACEKGKTRSGDVAWAASKDIVECS